MLGLFFVNLDAATAHRFNRLVAVGLATSTEAAFHLTGKAAMGLFAQVIEIEIEFIDQPPRNTHHLAPAGIGVVTVSGADDADAAMLKAFDHAFGFADFAAETVQAFKDENREATGQGIGQQRLATWPKRHGDAAADALVRMNGGDGPALALCPCTGFAELVFDGGFALLVGAISRIQADQRGRHRDS